MSAEQARILFYPRINRIKINYQSRNYPGPTRFYERAFPFNNLHLPKDLSICDQDPGCRNYAMESIAKGMGGVPPLYPSAHALHLPFVDVSFKKDAVKTGRTGFAAA